MLPDDTKAGNFRAQQRQGHVLPCPDLLHNLQKLAAKLATLEQEKAEVLALQFAKLNQKAAQVGATVQSPFEQVVIASCHM